MTVDEIKATVNDYRSAAVNAQKAGFSGIEVHSANGYLINRFLDSKTNLRTDQYVCKLWMDWLSVFTNKANR